MYMLDTNICIYVLQNRSDKLRHKFKAIKDLCISSITYAELCYGIEKGDPVKRLARFQQLHMFTQRLLVESWDEEAALHYGVIRAELKKQGSMIGSNDLLIAAHAISRKDTLVTNNESEFSRVSDLEVENWLD